MSSVLGNDSILNMYVYGDIVTDSHWLFGSEDDVVTREFIKDLQKHPNAKRINVYINSGGGEVFAAVTMAQQLKKHKAEVHTYVEGVAASAATIIAMAGDVRHMTVSGLYMIHLPGMGVKGNKHAMAKGIEVLEKVEDVIRMTYKTKVNISDEELTAMLDHEQWMTADEALAKGFIDVIEEEKDEVDLLMQDIKNDCFELAGVTFSITNYTEAEQLKAKLAEIAAKRRPSNNPKGGTIMNFDELMASLPTDQQTLIKDAMTAAVNAGVVTQSQKVVDLTNQVATLTTDLTAAQTSLSDMQKQLEDAQKEIQTLKASGEDEDTKFLNSLPAEARVAVLDARKIAAEAQAALGAAKEAEAFNTFKNQLSSYGNLPLEDKHYQALYNIHKSNPKDYAELEALFKVANTAMDGNFNQIGEDGEGNEPGNAFEEISQKVENLRKADATLSYNDAFAQVIAAEPALYDRYRNNM